MSIPKIQSNGLLPPGVYEATLDEIDEVFGRFQRTDRRITLMQKFRDFVREIQALGKVTEMIVNGSFITSKDEPSDIDVAVRIRDDSTLEEDVTPMEVLLLSSSSSRRKWSVETHVAYDAKKYKFWKRYFGGTRDGEEKGVLRLRLDK